MATAPEIRERVLELVEPLAARLGYELVDVEWAGGSHAGVLRLYVDRAPSQLHVGHIGVEDCELVSREASALLDVEDPIPGAYSLEVSSPGFDRVLRKPEHYARFVGSRVKLELSIPREGRRRYSGILQRAGAQDCEVEVDGDPVRFEYREIGKARLAA